MSKSPHQKRTPKGDPEQSKAFIEKAKEIGADGKNSKADDLLAQLAKMKPEPHSTKKIK